MLLLVGFGDYNARNPLVIHPPAALKRAGASFPAILALSFVVLFHRRRPSSTPTTSTNGGSGKGLTGGAAAATVAEVLGRSVSTVKTLVEDFEANDGRVTVKSAAGRGGTDRSGLLQETREQIGCCWIAAKHLNDTPVHAMDVWKWLKSEPPGNTRGSEGESEWECADCDRDRVALDVSQTTVRNWLKETGYKRVEGRVGTNET